MTKTTKPIDVSIDDAYLQSNRLARVRSNRLDAATRRAVAEFRADALNATVLKHVVTGELFVIPHHGPQPSVVQVEMALSGGRTV